MSADVWEPDDESPHQPPGSEEEVDVLLSRIDAAKEAHAIITGFNDFVLTTVHPDPPSDANSDTRDDSTTFQQGRENVHPARDDPRDVMELPSDDRDKNYGRLIDGVERHMCRRRGYCDKDKNKKRKEGDDRKPVNCRFDFPIGLASRTVLRVREFSLGKGEERRIKCRLELVTQRNDKWLNSHCRPIIESWRANMDMRLIVDAGKVVDYMTKYVTKTEMRMSRRTALMVQKILEQAIDDGQSVQAALKRTMAKLLGERVVCKQETCHLILSQQMASCSHNFVRINLDNNANRVTTKDDSPADDDDDGEAAKKKSATVKTILDAYGVRLDKTEWGSADVFSSVESDLPRMSLADFASKFYVGVKGALRDKIKPHQKGKFVALFYPRPSSNPDGKAYADYCKYSLMKYRPWSGAYESSWGGPNATSNDIIQSWDDFVDALRQSNSPLPDVLRREIDESFQYRRRRDVQVEEDEFVIANDDGAGEPFPSELADDEDWMLASEPADEGFLANELMWEPGDVNVRWNRNHDFSVLENEYPENFHSDLAAVSTRFEQVVADVSSRPARRTVSRENLNPRQRLAHDAVVRSASQPAHISSSTDGGTGPGRLFLVLGEGGTGKSYAVDAICSTLKLEHGFTDKNIRLMATTGKAATVIGGCTLHSHREGFGLPCGKAQYREWKGDRLKDAQKFHGAMKLLVIDEFSMLRQRELAYIDGRLRQIKAVDLPFGGVTVVMVGDPGQLPPVMGRCVWDASRSGANGDDLAGYGLYQLFTSVVQLVENRRLDPADPDSVWFRAFLGRLRNGNCTHADWLHVRKNCSRYTMGMNEWKRRGFEGADTTHLYVTNAEVHQHNSSCLQLLGKPIALVEAENTGSGKKFRADMAHGLENSLHLAVGAQVLMSKNVCQPAGLCNGATGVVKDLVYEPGVVAPGLPKFVWVDFGEQYTGRTFFEGNDDRRGWVPVHPTTATWWTPKSSGHGYDEHTRTMLPLRLAWAWTIWKAQGQTITNKMVVNLSSKEKEHGLTYTAFSRATKLSDIGLVMGICKDRLCRKVRTHKKMAPRIREEKRLNRLCKQTMRGTT